MHISNDIRYIGVNDHQIDLFEGQYIVPNGMAYNSYVIMDEKIAVLDTVDQHFGADWFANLEKELDGRQPDYLVVHHMEPDHAANIKLLLEKYPEIQVVASAKALQMIGQFFDLDLSGRSMEVKEGDTLSTGSHIFHFVAAPMVHWPEVLVSYDEKEKILFSADAFGTFGALNGTIFNDEVDFEREYLADARRYYANIVGKYGMQVQGLLKKAAGLDIQMICPLHGPIWRTDLGWFIDKYDKWSRYEPEEKAVVVLYGSIYGHTEQAVNALTCALAEKGARNIAVYDVSRTHVSDLIGEIFRASHLVIACPTYNGGIYPPMENLLTDMKALSVQKRTVALMENGTWAAASGKQILKRLEEMKEMLVLEEQLSLKSALKPERAGDLERFAGQIMETL